MHYRNVMSRPISNMISLDFFFHPEVQSSNPPEGKSFLLTAVISRECVRLLLIKDNIIDI